MENLKYSHYEIDGEFCFVYFVGKRNFVAILKGDELCFADYYDECNINENEKYFMRKLHDSLNHGRVCEIKEGKQSTYLVYLDNDEMNLKSEFLPCVFLDCVQAGNIKYLKNLLCEDLCKVESVENFFPEFDMCFQVKEDIVILTKKNTLAGVFKFEIDNCKIVNIIPLQCSFC